MKILITGSNGLLGQKLLKLLLQQESVKVLASSLGPNRSLFDNHAYDYFDLDITDEKSVGQLIQDQQPEVVINTAAMTQVDLCETEKQKCWKLNVLAVENLARACADQGSFLVHLSTDFIFDGKKGPYLESDSPNPISYYGESKLASEEIVHQSGASASILRTVLVFGYEPSISRSNIILWVKKSLEEGKSINVVTDQWRTPTLAEDLAMGCWLSAQKKQSGIFNISGEEMMTPYDMAIQTADCFGLNRSLIRPVDGTVFSQAAKRPPKTGFILDKAKEILNYQPTPFKEGLKLVKQQLLKKNA
jgi:dTDP-4-dehydrorhamnose reductase